LPPAVRSEAPRLQFGLERAMGKQPEDRFDSGREMAEALRQVLGAGASASFEAEHNARLASAALPPTAIMPPPAPPPPVAGGHAAIDASTLHVLEQKLAPYLGPIARIMVRSAAARAPTLEALCAALAASVPDGNERESFRRDVAPLLRTRPPALDDAPSHGSIGSFHEPELERATRALTQYLGPIARVLVRRAARDAVSIDGLWQALAAHIDQPAERAAFLRQRHV
jgi:serine/threonine-protein kinase